MSIPNITELLDELRKHEFEKFQKYVNARTQPRFIPTNSNIIVEYKLPDGSQSHADALLVNISQVGACISTPSPLQEDDPITINLISNDGQTCPTQATVKWCSFFREHSHESGILFDQPIDPRNFVSIHKHSELDTNTPKQVLMKHALVITSDPLSFNIFKVLLNNANIISTNAKSTEEALTQVQSSSFDFVFMTDNPTTAQTQQSISALQATGYTGPILVETLSPKERETDLLAAGAAAVLQRPVQPTPLLEALRKANKSSQSKAAPNASPSKAS